MLLVAVVEDEGDCSGDLGAERRTRGSGLGLLDVASGRCMGVGKPGATFMDVDLAGSPVTSPERLTVLLSMFWTVDKGDPREGICRSIPGNEREVGHDGARGPRGYEVEGGCLGC